MYIDSHNQAFDEYLEFLPKFKDYNSKANVNLLSLKEEISNLSSLSLEEADKYLGIIESRYVSDDMTFSHLYTEACKDPESEVCQVLDQVGFKHECLVTDCVEAILSKLSVEDQDEFGLECYYWSMSNGYIATKVAMKSRFAEVIAIHTECQYDDDFDHDGYDPDTDDFEIDDSDED